MEAKVAPQRLIEVGQICSMLPYYFLIIRKPHSKSGLTFCSQTNSEIHEFSDSIHLLPPDCKIVPEHIVGYISE